MQDLLRIMGGPILDPFMGSASIGEASADLGLPYIGVEALAHYFDVACKRLEEHAAGRLAA